MRDFDVQAIDVSVPRARAFAFVSDRFTLPRWTNAFVSVDDEKAVMQTPAGIAEVDLSVRSHEASGAVDWRMIFPDGSVATAFSRTVELEAERCAFAFVLTAPPVPLEQLEGALDEQSRTLAEELRRLKSILEADD